MAPDLLVLDGPTGTELVARGLHTHPILWTALAAETHPDLLLGIHEDYLASGARVLTANTFRTHSFSAREAGLTESRARELTFRSVEIARKAASKRAGTLVAGSLAPLADCYAPHLTPADAILSEVHEQTASWMVEAGCDLILAETMGTLREAQAAVAAARRQGKTTIWLSLIPAPEGERLLGGDLLIEAARAGLAAGADALLLNCVHPEVVDRALPYLPHEVKRGAYANAARMYRDRGQPRWENDLRPLPVQAKDYAQRASAWARHQGLQILGGCCGTTPLHIRLISELHQSATSAGCEHVS